MQLSDPEIISGIKQGDQHCFEQVFREYYKPLLAYSRKFIRDAEEAEEIVQDLFFNFWEKRSQIEINTSLKSYLFRSAHNTCLNQIKHEKVKNKYQEYFQYRFSASFTEATEKLEEEELLMRVQKAMDSMPDKVRNTFMLIRHEEMKYKEVAEKLGISVKTVEAHMGAALKHLREHLKEFTVILVLVFSLIFL